MVKLRSGSISSEPEKMDDNETEDPVTKGDSGDPGTTTLTSCMRALEFRHLHKVFFIRREMKTYGGDVKIVPLRNPCTDLTSRYICQHDVGRYYQIMKYCEPNRSWFVDEVLTIDGAIFMTTLIDPLFLVLPYIQRGCHDKFVPLDNVLKDEKYPEISSFVDEMSMEQLLLICDHKGPKDLKAIRYNEEKTLHWLAFKCEKFMMMLEEKNIYVEGGAKSETYVKSEKLQTDPDTDARLTYCIEVIYEYIPRNMRDKLLMRLGAEAAKPTSKSSSHKRKLTSETEAPGGSQKRSKDDSSSDSPTSTPKAEEKRVTARAKALTKAAAGTKNIMSFFKKK